MGYGDETKCKIDKYRVFNSTHADGFVAHNYGKHLAKEFGPKLYTCVVETLQVIGSKNRATVMRYKVIHNGDYYVKAIPHIHHIFPK